MPVARVYKKGEKLKYMVQGIDYKCPPLPEPSAIRGSHLPKADQVWYRRTEHEQWDWNITPYDENKNKLKLWHENPAKGQMEWYEAEIERIHTGEWVMINGVPTFFNKYCYFFHQWFVLLTEQRYPMFKETSIEYFRFFELCEEDPLCLGDLGIKGRRLGLSSMSSSTKLQLGIIEDNTLQGIVSKTGTDAQEMYFMVKNGLENLPLFLVPELNKVTDSEIHIAKQAKRISSNNRTINADKGKNNRINWLDTAENAYDGRNVRHVTIDEGAKWEKVNVNTCLTKISETLVVGASVSGHVSMFSTVNKGDKGGDNFRKIWDGSDHISGTKDMFGRTKTKMKRFFIAGYRGLLGYVGKYGESIIENPNRQQVQWMSTYINPATGKLACPNPNIGAKQFLEESRKMNAADPEEYAEVVRMYPFEWKEVFKGANSRCMFNLDELNDQIFKVETELDKIGQKENGRRMSFRKEQSGEVRAIDDSSGFWWILELPKEHNKCIVVGSIKCPNNTEYAVAGLDPIATTKVTVEKGSDACCIIHKRYNALNPSESGMPIAMFIGRPKTKDHFHEQIYWALQYYGIKMLAERMPIDWEDYAVNPANKLASPVDFVKKVGFLIQTTLSNKTMVYGVAAQSKEGIEQHATEMVEYANNNIHKIKFLRLLKDMVSFDPKDRTVYDACMAWGYALMGLKDAHTKTVAVKKVQKILQIKRSKKYY